MDYDDSTVLIATGISVIVTLVVSAIMSAVGASQDYALTMLVFLVILWFGGGLLVGGLLMARSLRKHQDPG